MIKTNYNQISNKNYICTSHHSLISSTHFGTLQGHYILNKKDLKFKAGFFSPTLGAGLA